MQNDNARARGIIQRRIKALERETQNYRDRLYNAIDELRRERISLSPFKVGQSIRDRRGAVIVIEKVDVAINGSLIYRGRRRLLNGDLGRKLYSWDGEKWLELVTEDRTPL